MNILIVFNNTLSLMVLKNKAAKDLLLEPLQIKNFLKHAQWSYGDFNTDFGGKIIVYSMFRSVEGLTLTVDKVIFM